MNCFQFGRTTKKYSPRLRTFALTLHFYSPRGYRYVRSVFNNSLPAISTIRKWYSVIDGKPGFSSEAFTALKLKSIEANTNGKQIMGCVMFDEMAIRKQVEFDEHGNRSTGQVNFGTNVDSAGNELYAKEALVYMVTGVNMSFKIPVAYFLISGLTAEEKAAITKEVILLVSKTGVKVIGLVFDGLVSNFAMARTMGANVYKDKLYINNPHSDEKILVFPDACHMLKLARNRLAIKRKLYDNDGNAIEWRYVEELEKYQRETGVNLGNKINKTHVQWEKKKMSVRLAAETLSNSVADSLDFLRNKGVAEFLQSEPTAKYMRRINNVFDICNSMYEDGIHFKAPISPHNKERFFAYMDESIEYMKNLKLLETGKSILKTRSKIPFLGFSICLKNFRTFYLEYVEQTAVLPYVMTFRFSQDHLELLFACIRQMFGCNDNPSAKQFESAWRRLLGNHQITASESANCQNNSVEFLTVLNSSSRKESNLKLMGNPEGSSIVQVNNELVDDEISEEEFANLRSLIMDPSFESLENHMIAYTASVIQDNLIKGKWYFRIDCQQCLKVFAEDEIMEDELVELKMKTKNLHPLSKSTFDICLATEKLMDLVHFEPEKYKKFPEECLQILRYDEIFPFSNFDEHIETNHKKTLITVIIKMYVKKRQEYISRCNTIAAHDENLRCKLKKIIHFKGQ